MALAAAACGGTVNVASEPGGAVDGGSPVVDGGNLPPVNPADAGATEWQIQRKLVLDPSAPNDHFGAPVTASSQFVFSGAVGYDALGRAIDVVHVFERRGTHRFVHVDRLDLDASETLDDLAAAGDGVLVRTTKHAGDGTVIASRIAFVRKTGNSFSVVGDLPLPATDATAACAIRAQADVALVADTSGAVHLFAYASGTWSLVWNGAVERVLGPNTLLRCPVIAVSSSSFAVAARTVDAAMTFHLFDRAASTITERAPIVVRRDEVGDPLAASAVFAGSDLVASFFVPDVVTTPPTANDRTVVRIATRDSGFSLGGDVLAASPEVCRRVSGCAVSGDATRFVVASYDSEGRESPIAVIFATGAGGWKEAARVTPTLAGADAHGFGRPTLAGPVLVGTSWSTNGDTAGALLAFVEDGGVWSPSPSDGAPFTLDATEPGLGNSVAASGADVVVAGRANAYVYDSTKAGVEPVAVLTPAAEDAVGLVAMVANTVVATTGYGGEGGGASVFSRDPSGVWSEAAPLPVHDLPGGHVFGSRLSFDGDTIAVGAEWLYASPGTTNTFAFLFEKRGDAWTQTQILETADSEIAYADQAVVMSVSRGHLLFAGHHDRDASVYARDAAGAWSKSETLTIQPTDGRTVAYFEAGALDGDRAILAARETGSTSISTATWFERDASGAFVQVARLTPSDFDSASTPAPISSVSIAGDYVSIGVAASDLAPGYGADSPMDGVYLFQRTATGLARVRVLRPTNAKGAPRFGAALAMTPSLLAIGSPGDRAAYLVLR